MFWWIKEPVQASFFPVVICCCVVFAASWIAGKSFLRALLVSVIASVVIFLAIFNSMLNQVDAGRFGGFAYPNKAAIKHYKIAYWMPAKARDITVYSNAMGHVARFRIDPNSFIEWLNEERKRNGDGAVFLPGKGKVGSEKTSFDMFELHFRNTGWDYPDDNIEFQGPRAANGAGFTVYYSPKQGYVYLSAGYW
jgi:hypothetical protein